MTRLRAVSSNRTLMTRGGATSRGAATECSPGQGAKRRRPGFTARATVGGRDACREGAAIRSIASARVVTAGVSARSSDRSYFAGVVTGVVSGFPFSATNTALSFAVVAPLLIA